MQFVDPLPKDFFDFKPMPGRYGVTLGIDDDEIEDARGISCFECVQRFEGHGYIFSLHNMRLMSVPTLMQVAVNAGVAAIAAECGEACACGTCHCYLDNNWSEILPEPAGDERDMLEFVIDPTEFSRLSCQVQVTNEMDGLIVQVPPSQI